MPSPGTDAVEAQSYLLTVRYENLCTLCWTCVPLCWLGSH